MKRALVPNIYFVVSREGTSRLILMSGIWDFKLTVIEPRFVAASSTSRSSMVYYSAMIQEPGRVRILGSLWRKGVAVQKEL